MVQPQQQVGQALEAPDDLFGQVGGWLEDPAAGAGSFAWDAFSDVDFAANPALRTDLDFDLEAFFSESASGSQQTIWPLLPNNEQISSQESDFLLESGNVGATSDVPSEATYSSGAWSTEQAPWLDQSYNPGFPPQGDPFLTVEHASQSAWSQTSATISLSAQSRRSTTTSYPCLHPGCVATFETQCRRKHHMRCHTPYDRRPQVCPTCHMRFIWRKDLIRHNLKHDGTPGTFLCPRADCEERFKRADHLSRHVKKAHSNDRETTSNSKTDGAAPSCASSGSTMPLT